MKYRSELTEVIRHVVLQPAADAQELVSAWTAGNIPESDRQQFADLVHVELKGLHEGNIARFRLRPVEFLVWREGKGRGEKH